MDYTAILSAVAVVSGTGILLGALLGIAEIKFMVKVDEKETAVRKLLPGSNCGGCGYPGCDGLAAAIAKGDAPADKCPGCSAERVVKIGRVMCVEMDPAKMVRKAAYVKCSGNCETTKEQYEYYGVKNCREAMFTAGGGPKACTYGCLGYGECVSVCAFDAIHIENGTAVVDREKCVACGKCVEICPKHLIEIIPYESKFAVGCNSKEKGKDTKAVCGAGCIGCKICMKNCPNEAIEVTDNLAVINQEKCIGCGICAGKCPVKIIKMV